MRVVRLQAENFMRLVAIDITPEGHVVRIGGKNGAGKTAAMNSIAVALGGMALAPEEPLREGEAEGFVRVDIGEYLVTRKFSRDRMSCNCEGADAGSHDPRCDSRKFGETRSTLLVTNKDGFKAPSP